MIAAMISGLLCAVSLPTSVFGRLLPNLSFLSWFSLVPLYLSIRNETPQRAFWKGILFGAVFFGASLYWAFIALHRYGEVPVWGSLLGLAALTFLCSLFPAAVCSVSARFCVGQKTFHWCFVLSWLVFEFLRNYFPFGGFAWSNLAYSQRESLKLIQILDVTGIYGVLFLLLLGNVLAAEVYVWVSCRGTARRALTADVTPPSVLAGLFSLCLVTTILYGYVRLEKIRAEVSSAPRLKVSIVQGNIPQEEKWMDEKIEEILNHHIGLSKSAEEDRPDLVVWPEAAFPAVVPPDLTKIDELGAIERPLLMGVVSYDGTIPENWPPKPGDPSFALYNSAMLIEPGGYIADRYHKRHLVPMGEYVPLGAYLPFVSQIVDAVSSFTPGKEYHLMTLAPAPPTPLPRNGGEGRRGEGKTQFGTTICYEDLFPEISRKFTHRGADFLVNLTNDGWYDRSSAVYQHFDFSRFRAIENRRTMVRATNTGKTAFFSPTGEIIAAAPPFEEATLTAEIPLMKMKSPYTRYGDVFAWGCVAGLLLVVARRYFSGI